MDHGTVGATLAILNTVITRIREFLSSTLLVLGSLVVSVIAADLGMRAVGFSPPISQPWHLTSGSRYRVADDNLIMISPRLLTDDYYAADPSLKTVVTIGDSFTEGYPVTPAYSYPEAIGRLLDRQGCAANLINMGLGNSGPDQHLRLMKALVLPNVRPDIVVWQFYSNDIGDNIRQALYDVKNSELVPLTGRHWINTRYRLYDSIPVPQSLKERSPVVRLLLGGLELVGDRRIPTGTREVRNEWALEKIRLAVKEMGRLAKAHGFEVYYVLVSPQARYLDLDDPSIDASDRAIRSHDRLYSVLGGLPNFIDAWFGDTYANPRDPDFAVPPTALESPDIFADERRDGNSLGDRHFNEIGYQLLAEAVVEQIGRHCSE